MEELVDEIGFLEAAAVGSEDGVGSGLQRGDPAALGAKGTEKKKKLLTFKRGGGVR